MMLVINTICCLSEKFVFIRYCFVECGHDSGHLQDAEYNVLCENFELLDDNLDLGVDLIGKNF